MSTWGYVAIGASLSQVVLVALILLVRRDASRTRLLYGLLMLAVFGYLMIPLTPEWSGNWIFGSLSTLVPGAFWLFSASLFDDHYDFSWWQPTLVALSVLMPTAFELSGQPHGTTASLVLVEGPQLAEFAFLALALAAIFGNWKDDLLVQRRNLRLWFCGISGIFITSLILAREVFFAGAPWLAETQYMATAVVMTGTNFILMQFVPGLLNPIRREKPEKAEPEKEPDEVQEQLAPVLRLVEEEGIHREWGMTIGKLAEASNIPEYKLRQLINSGLGFRNFNDFLNNYRIQEASRRLLDPEEAKVPVLTIALDVGFRSISSFNKAFKDIHQMTPTAYRKQKSPPTFH